MTQAKAPISFSTWLRGELDSRGYGIRTLARKMNPENPEQARRALNRYVHQGMRPTQANRDALAAALGIEEKEIPSDDDEEESSAMTLEAVLRREIRRLLVEERERV